MSLKAVELQQSGKDQRSIVFRKLSVLLTQPKATLMLWIVPSCIFESIHTCGISIIDQMMIRDN
jgi:hypothetical protein